MTACGRCLRLQFFLGKNLPLKEFKLRTISAPALCRQQSSQSATRTFWAPRNFGGSATFTLLKVQVTSTAARDGLALAHLGALSGQARYVQIYVPQYERMAIHIHLVTHNSCYISNYDNLIIISIFVL